MSDYLDPNNEELLKDFFVEAQMQVETLEQNILVLENDPNNKDAVDEIFRAAHTLKGGAATVQMTELSEFTHIVEDVLDEIRSGKVSISGDTTDILLDSIDIIKAMMEARAGGSVYDEDTSTTEEKLKAHLSGNVKPIESNKPPEKNLVTKSTPRLNETKTVGVKLSEHEFVELKEAAGDDSEIYKAVVSFDPDNPMNTVGGIQAFAILKEKGKVLRTVPDFESLYEDNFFPQVEYYFTTEISIESLQKSLKISDVTTDVVIDTVSSDVNDDITGEVESNVEATSTNLDQKDSAEIIDKSEELNDQLAVAHSESKEGVTNNSIAPKKGIKSPDAKKINTMGSILRVDSKRIDNLLNLVSETVINKATFNQISNQFSENLSNLQASELEYKDKLKSLFEEIPYLLETLQNGTSVKDIKKQINEKYGNLFSIFDKFEGNLKGTVGTFRGTAQNLGRIISDLHESVLRIRMVPISQIFSRFPRLVRDLSKTLNKKIELHIEGEDTELDKSVIEDLLDPLIHCVRNSMDHGVEHNDERKKKGKSSDGNIWLRASNEGNMIIIEIEDDGKGIDVNMVKQKAIERGLIHPSKNLSDVEAFNLIFEPGFSTAKKVSNISGRGVGLDVVRKQIEKLNGNVNVWSVLDKGSKFTIKLPLTLAIIQGLLVRVNQEIYAIPITSVIDSHRIRPTEIKLIDGYEVFNVRDDVISLIRLNRLFGMPEEEKRDYHFVVVVGSGDKKMGLVVDSLIGEEDVVIKPLKDKYTNSPGIAGATILGDGKVSLIIDVSQILELGLKRERQMRQQREHGIK
ncbi:chemotaxis protein CheA [Spirochaeta cellobiosiphila]|uniref:chemotaxis protein CheA n=1 Tax=Spirochaeta cellobiosiphila TaxID=504483 RepID=UPI0004037FAC|nr:chemotaxis protein CheA [Spirochaeta cellobiosiphila]